jgi:2OG-Fe(II) oxygenase superfamily
MLEKWINSIYLKSYENGSLFNNCCELLPFKCAILENFLTDNALERLLNSTKNLTFRKVVNEKKPLRFTDLHACTFSDMEFLSFFYGREFRSFLNTLLNESILTCSKSIPRIALLKENSKGIGVHTDKDPNVGIVTLLQLTQIFNGYGGDLIFYKNEKGKLKEFIKLPPKLNTFVIFKPNEHSYHSVSDMHGKWERKTFMVDWYAADSLPVNIKSLHST